MLRFIQKSIEFPSVNFDDSIPALKVVVRFVVNEDGEISDFKIVKGSSPSFNNAVIRVLKNLKAFKPGIKDGKPVRVYCTIPIMFELGR